MNSFKGIKIGQILGDQKLNSTGKLTLKVPAAESNLNIIYNIKFLCMQFFIIPDIEALCLRPLKPRQLNLFSDSPCTCAE